MSHCQMLCFCFLWAYERVLRRSFSLLERLKKLQMQVFDQPVDTTGNRGQSETECIKKREYFETAEENF